MKKIISIFGTAMTVPAFAFLLGGLVTNPSSVVAAAWGAISGVIGDQTDLATSLAAKAPIASPAFTGTPTVGTNLTMGTTGGGVAYINQSDGSKDLELWQDGTWRARIRASDGYLQLRHGIDVSTVAANIKTALIMAADGTPAVYVTSGYVNPGLPLLADEGVTLRSSGTKPTCSSSLTVRFRMWCTAGGTGVADFCQICKKDSSDVYAWTTF